MEKNLRKNLKRFTSRFMYIENKHVLFVKTTLYINNLSEK